MPPLTDPAWNDFVATCVIGALTLLVVVPWIVHRWRR